MSQAQEPFTKDTGSYANKCTTTLTAGSTCVLKGTFVAADTAAGQLIKATYSYDQGNNVESSTTAVTPVAAVTAATITTSTDLPATVYVGKSYPVVFTGTLIHHHQTIQVRPLHLMSQAQEPSLKILALMQINAQQH